MWVAELCKLTEKQDAYAGTLEARPAYTASLRLTLRRGQSKGARGLGRRKEAGPACPTPHGPDQHRAANTQEVFAE